MTAYSTPSARFFLPNEEATVLLAKLMAEPISALLSTHYDNSPPLDSAYHIHLQGDLGVGKTAFSRAFLRALGVTGRIKSPSYTLVETYKVSRLYLYHFDFYRFNNSTEWQEAGFRENLLENAVVLIEWPEKADQSLPSPDILLTLRYHDEGRIAELNASSHKGRLWIGEISKQARLPLAP